MKKKVCKKKVEEVKEIDNLIADLEIDEEPVEKLKLSDEELKKDVTLLFNAENPYFSDELVEFSFKDLAYKTLSNFPHTVTLFSQSGYFIHKDLLKRRDEAEVKDAFPAEELVSRRKNKFNFCDRAVQTLNNAFRETGLQAECPPQTKIGINATLIEITEAALFKENEDKTVTSSQRQKKNELLEVAFTAKVLERMVNQNNFLDVTLDFGFYDNPYDEFLENGMGSILPLWKFCYKDTKGMTTTSISWNYHYPDMFAVGYGTNQFLREMKGFICIYTLKCPLHPERTFICDTGVQSIDFHHQWHHLLAAGFLDGIVAVFDLRRNEDIAFAVSGESGIQHTDMISQVKWLDDNIDNQHIFCSLGSDGRVISWCLVESELIGTEVISLNNEKCHVDDGPEGTRMDAISGGVSMSFNNHNLNLFLVGTEDGLVHKCSGFYSNRYLSTYASHKNIVCSIEWNPYLPQIFLSCSEDWTICIWHEQHSKHCFVFDMFSPIKAATWAPFSSTLFAAITKDRKIHIFDLAINRQKPICSYTYSQRNSEMDLNLTSIAFNPKLPIILAGDDKGRVLSFKLSPNLRSSIRGGNQECQQTIKRDILFLPEPEIDTPNPVDFSHPRLTKGRRSTGHDKDLKPNAKTSNQLNEIVSYPPTKCLAAKEKDLLWKFRFSLIRQKKALAKFLKCINWKMSDEAEHALDLLTRWQGMDVEDALELFSPAYTNPTVRRYAVTRLQLAPDEDLLMYLLQLVQALKYENFDEISCDLYREFSGSVSSEPTVKNESPDCGIISAESDPMLKQTRDPSSRLSLKVESDSAISKYDLATFLINRACANDTLANYLFWYVKVESEDQNSSAKYSEAATDMYNTVRRRLSHALSEGSMEYKHRWAMLMRQQLFVHKLLTLIKTVAKENENRQKKIERLQTLLSNSEINKFNFTEFEPFPLLLDPTIKVKGILPEKATLFKSAFMPCLLTFVTVEGAEYMTIFKHGDDLRQDQLSLQMITLMDKLLKKEGLDLKLTPYHVLATGTNHGFVQCVDSVAVAAVLATEGSIQNFFRKHAPAEDGPYGISPEVMDTYVKSCAGYCVITYLLGVGDRHLDNLLLTKAGKLFHIDFGYILGRDPKPLPPPMKLCKEMVEAMGGINSEHYEEFRKHCYAAFLHLRRYAPLILNLFSLMVDANIPDIALEPDKAVKKIQDKFRLDLTDVEAINYLQDIIDDSVTAVMAAFVEQIHKIAQYLRK